jgi:hypothetical protein
LAIANLSCLEKSAIGNRKSAIQRFELTVDWLGFGAQRLDEALGFTRHAFRKLNR